MGGVAATFIARLRIRSREEGCCTMTDHLVTGLAMATRSAAICASMAW